MNHQLKIHQCYLIHILEGKKTFEVRLNDRDFQTGDTLTFLPLADDAYDVYQAHPSIPRFVINYVLSNFGGLQPGYVVLAITPLD